MSSVIPRELGLAMPLLFQLSLGLAFSAWIAACLRFRRLRVVRPWATAVVMGVCAVGLLAAIASLEAVVWEAWNAAGNATRGTSLAPFEHANIHLLIGLAVVWSAGIVVAACSSLRRQYILAVEVERLRSMEVEALRRAKEVERLREEDQCRLKEIEDSKPSPEPIPPEPAPVAPDVPRSVRLGELLPHGNVSPVNSVA